MDQIGSTGRGKQGGTVAIVIRGVSYTGGFTGLTGAREEHGLDIGLPFLIEAHNLVPNDEMPPAALDGDGRDDVHFLLDSWYVTRDELDMRECDCSLPLSLILPQPKRTEENYVPTLADAFRVLEWDWARRGLGPEVVRGGYVLSVYDSRLGLVEDRDVGTLLSGRPWHGGRIISLQPVFFHPQLDLCPAMAAGLVQTETDGSSVGLFATPREAWVP